MLSNNFNFDITYGLGHMNILPAPLTVKADDKVILDDSLLPVFTSSITGFKNGDSTTIQSWPVYSVSPVYHIEQPGIYTIIPSGLVLKNPFNYTISYATGNLYVNPDNGSNIVPKLDCVEKLTNDPSGFPYRAHFSYQNKNVTAIFIPIGPNNIFQASGKYSGQQPQLFVPGGGQFVVYFDGLKLIWTVTTFQSGHNSSVSSSASSTSSKCSGASNNSITGIAIDGTVTEEESTAAKPSVYPNPVTDKLIINIPDHDLSAIKEVEAIDMYGKNYRVVTKILSLNSMQINLSGVSSGIYIIRIKLENEFRIFRIMKR